MQIEMKKAAKAYNKFTVKMELTEGAILAIRNALEAWNTPVAADINTFWIMAAEKAGIKFVPAPYPTS